MLLMATLLAILGDFFDGRFSRNNSQHALIL